VIVSHLLHSFKQTLPDLHSLFTEDEFFVVGMSRLFLDNTMLLRDKVRSVLEDSRLSLVAPMTTDDPCALVMTRATLVDDSWS
jgi:hypothetical protein